LNRLAATIDTQYVEKMLDLKINPWEMRNRYIQVMLGRVSLDELAVKVSGRQLNSEQLGSLKVLLEAQRYRQQMFMSCGWFFEDFSRIEPRNNVAYAAQAVNLMNLATGISLADQVSADLYYVVSQATGIRGDTVFRGYLRKAADDEFTSIQFPAMV
jgi:hypothetical protein